MPDQEPTWDMIGSLAHAVFMLTQANITHDQLVRLAGPIIREIESMREIMESDPYGDADSAGE